MGIFDKFLNVMKLNDDEYDDDDFYDDDDEYFEEDEKPKSKKFFGRSESAATETKEGLSFSSKSTKVTPIRSTKKNNNMSVCVIKPDSMEDTREITETLLANRTVVLNLEGLNVEIAQRIIDFTSGSTYAINGNLKKISNYIFIVTPSSVDISGDLQDILNGAFDSNLMQSGFHY